MKNQKNFIKTTLVASALISGGAALNVQAENAFTANLLGSGSEVRSALSTNLFTPIPDLKFELKCGEATKESKTKEAKCGEGKCGEGEKKAEKSSEKKADVKTEKKAEKKSESKSSEAKCGEGKCGTF
ncbi:MAG: hypothetical protein H0S84_08180 [Bacteroidales bacterium]|jgi:uncharacterized low-complexity protein|nr:hypothetical protein [Bacteroidales bacterium]MDN5350281.1 hypothetical protein [Bacteroidales bacterium]